MREPWAAAQARTLRRRRGDPCTVLGGSLPDRPLNITQRVYGRLLDAIRAAEAQALAGVRT